jgi:ATP-dependent RNA helicase DDX23/PRP28
MIKGKYYGAVKEKKKILRPGDKFKQVFVFDWDAREDTSQEINPLYAKKHDPKILFGKGFMAGVDHEHQKQIYDSKGNSIS